MQFEAGAQPERGAESPFPPLDTRYQDLPAQTWCAYGAKEGIPRLLDLWDRKKIKVTSHMVGQAVDRNPQLAKEEVIVAKVWLITGSSRGLGRALADAVLAAGHELVATARNPARLADLVERYGDQVRCVTLMTYVVMPLVTRLLLSWLSPGSPSQNRQGAINWWREHQVVGSHNSKSGVKP